MIELFFSIACLYLLVAIGFAWKKYLAPELNERHLSLLMLYFLAPSLVFWGFSVAPLTWEVLQTALYFTLLCLVLWSLLALATWLAGWGPRQRIVFTMTNLLMNTGNLGIPVGLAFFGPASLPFTTSTNLVSTILNYTVGVYSYSRGAMTWRQALLNIFKLPVLYLAALAIALNLWQVQFPSFFTDFLNTIGYTAIGFQLIVLGVFLSTFLSFTKPSSVTIISVGSKLIVLPLMTFALIKGLSLEGLLAQILLLQSLMPAAVNNLNLSSMYHCRPEEVTPIVFWSSALGLVTIPVGLWLLI